MSTQNFILVMSGKGGVGKSTTAANIARAYAAKYGKVGLLDLDLTGPSIPTLFGIKDKEIKSRNGKMVPQVVDGVQIVSLGLMLSDPHDAVIWRGPKKSAMINQFFQLIDWNCNTVIVDLPPGTSDEHLSTFEILNKNGFPYSVVIVTTPNVLAVADVRKGINLCMKVNAKIIGIIENFCGVVCPCCNQVSPLLGDKAAEIMSEELHLDILAKIPFLPQAASAADKGEKSDVILSFFNEVIDKIVPPAQPVAQ
ncbi:nucleotide binding protein, putative [Trichomonas vaginalis G3]|uniref:Nucleotide binding protein, putative n=1 Tax=Trichomonas vaginalis (strain ATCC PRA-98 / G3) TaxID=412133 RepID=A2DS16_TRIV3|nr:NUBPL iron-transfer P-loop NTPase (ParA) family [Trichomonas vaginalis G3]EAY16786.1 nucleotide binding protein, putative [Trichomonas vaginalis G3]KAI5490803.1 NUBPL iron-transfer P-loop NTPase (ParA) family [Trichomonas vaginalis G3]|eukprot:XP_001329009.1 nucleotide binding protein [Trichomonas vaginalis G3]